MADLIQEVSSQLLDEEQLTLHGIEGCLARAMVAQVDYADLYLQASSEESWTLEDGVVKQASFDSQRGFGVRVLSGAKTGFAYADNISQLALSDAVSSARAIVHGGGSHKLQAKSPAALQPLYSGFNPLGSMQDQDKIALLNQIDSYARAQDPRVTQVVASLSAVYDTVLMLNSEGHWAADRRPLVSLNIQVVVEQGGRRETGRAGGGNRSDYLYYTVDDLCLRYAEKAVQQALTNLDAIEAPAGVMPVVLGPGWPAVLLHEAVGHGLEADYNRKGSSAYSGRIGQQVASSLCTIVDDGTLVDRRGSLTVDDEGIATQCTTLIEQGVLKGYMYDSLNARLMKKQPTGNGRRESYGSLVLPRMTNTYMLPGQSDPQEIIGSVERGIYAVDFSGGQVDITSGQFVFCASEAYLIEKGKVTCPIKGVSLIGNGPEVLNHVSMVGNDLALDSGCGTCGKAGQSVEVGVGQPTLKIDRMTVGGSS